MKERLEKNKKIKKLMVKIEDLELYEKLDDNTCEMENLYDDLKENAILDVEKFKRQLEQQNLMTEQLEEFIENYMRFDNVC